jgi:DNA-binding MurR/RpiR family transcriptional regulator
MMGPRDVLILLTFEPRPKVVRALLAHARTTRMRVITLTDHAYAPQAERFSEVVLPCHVASYGMLPTHATMLSILRLIAVTYLGRNPDAVTQRISTLAAIDEEFDLFE